jgi:hypothetical protein
MKGLRPARRAAWTGWLRRLALAVAVAACAWWALGPMEHPEVEKHAWPPPPPTAAPPARQLLSLDVSAFSAPLWVAPPSAPVAEATASTPPLRLQLVAIVRDGESLRAVLYDPDTDRLLVSGPGDAVGDGTIESVSLSGLVLRNPSGTRTLSLNARGPVGGVGGGGGEAREGGGP